MEAVGTSKKRKAADSGDGADKDPTVQEVLSQELQLYYENVTSAVLQGSPHLLAAALQSLRSDPGLQALLPYLTQFITEEVRRSLKDLPILNALLSMTYAILSNKQLHVEPYLHLLMPAVMTSMVGKQLCKSSLEPHWALRDRAARLLTFICLRYSAPYSTLQHRITTTLMHAFLDATKPLTTNYGAVVGLSALGVQVSKPQTHKPKHWIDTPQPPNVVLSALGVKVYNR
jgi:transcription initiation factor TFIID subunit 6